MKRRSPQLLAPDTIDISSEAQFLYTCGLLASEVSSFSPSLVVGIETGGAVVAAALHSRLDDQPEVQTVRLQRVGTRWKSALRFGKVAERLPTPVADILRWLEVEVREFKHRQAQRSISGDRDSDWQALAVASRTSLRILIVDDTIDSGSTISEVAKHVQSANPMAEVRTAVIASTWRNPPVQPDYCLYTRTLVRFPWSFDAR